MISFIGIIPARYGSSRFPGKPLADIKGKSMIQRVYERAGTCIETVIVATDDKRIEAHVKGFGGKVTMTSPDHQSGTDRCAEALKIFEKDTSESFDIVINIQGDEPFIHKTQIELIRSCFEDNETQIATLIKKIQNYSDMRKVHLRVLMIAGKVILKLQTEEQSFLMKLLSSHSLHRSGFCGCLKRVNSYE